MKWSGFCVLAALVLAFVCLLDGHRAAAAPSSTNDELIKTLQNLEQIYSSMSRPRFGKRDRFINANMPSNDGYYRSLAADYADLPSIDDDATVPAAAGGISIGGGGGSSGRVAEMSASGIAANSPPERQLRDKMKSYYYTRLFNY